MSNIVSLLTDNCPPGTYLNNVCVECPIGFYQPNIGQLDCIQCPASTPITNFPGSTSLNDCNSKFEPLPNNNIISFELLLRLRLYNKDPLLKLLKSKTTHA